MIFHQLFDKESSTFTYLLADEKTREALIIDPVLECFERDLNLIRELNLKLKYSLETHVHADHITSSKKLKEATGAKIGLSSLYRMSCPDLQLGDHDQISFGEYKVEVIETPGHTIGCLTYKVEDKVFTGDALLIRGCGRTDFQGGSSETLYHSVKEKIFGLNKNTQIYPAHDYKGFMSSTVEEERNLNPRLHDGVTKEEFIEIMNELKLAYPKKIDEAVPANQLCGVRELDPEQPSP